IQDAFNYSGLAAGDHIKIRTGNRPYDENAYTASGKDGAPGNPIVVEPDTGNTPNIISTSQDNPAGAIDLYNVKNWTVQNLTFDACGTPYTSKWAIEVEYAEPSSTYRNLDGITITGNNINCWGGSNQNGGPWGSIAISVTGQKCQVFSPYGDGDCWTW